MLLTEDRSAKLRPARSAGLFHIAILYPTRKELAAAFTPGSMGMAGSFHGFADHGVSEALYLADADGNGIELYVDRPREQWPYRNGKLEMVTEPLDLDGLLRAQAPFPTTIRKWTSDRPYTSAGHKPALRGKSFIMRRLVSISPNVRFRERFS